MEEDAACFVISVAVFIIVLLDADVFIVIGVIWIIVIIIKCVLMTSLLVLMSRGCIDLFHRIAIIISQGQLRIRLACCSRPPCCCRAALVLVWVYVGFVVAWLFWSVALGFSGVFFVALGPPLRRAWRLLWGLVLAVVVGRVWVSGRWLVVCSWRARLPCVRCPLSISSIASSSFLLGLLRLTRILPVVYLTLLLHLFLFLFIVLI